MMRNQHFVLVCTLLAVGATGALGAAPQSFPQWQGATLSTVRTVVSPVSGQLKDRNTMFMQESMVNFGKQSRVEFEFGTSSKFSVYSNSTSVVVQSQTGTGCWVTQGSHFARDGPLSFSWVYNYVKENQVSPVATTVRGVKAWSYTVSSNGNVGLQGNIRRLQVTFPDSEWTGINGLGQITPIQGKVFRINGQNEELAVTYDVVNFLPSSTVSVGAPDTGCTLDNNGLPTVPAGPTSALPSQHPLPSIANNYNTVATASIVEKSYLFEMEESYDYILEAMLVKSHVNGSRSTILSRPGQGWEYVTPEGGACTAKPLPAGRGPFSRHRLQSSAALFHIGSQYQAAFNGSYVIRGIACNAWTVSFFAGPALGTLTLREYFSMDQWVYNGKTTSPVPVRVELHGARNYHVYDYAQWKAIEHSPSLFYPQRTPLCQGGTWQSVAVLRNVSSTGTMTEYGSISFQQSGSSVYISAALSNLPKNTAIAAVVLNDGDLFAMGNTIDIKTMITLFSTTTTATGSIVVPFAQSSNQYLFGSGSLVGRTVAIVNTAAGDTVIQAAVIGLSPPVTPEVGNIANADGAPAAAVAVLQATSSVPDNQASGVIAFKQDGKPGSAVRVYGTIQGLPANSMHGFHVHTYGDLGKSDGTATGGHYNPYLTPHGYPGTMKNGLINHHVGDMGNITADSNGVAIIDMSFNFLQLTGLDTIVGRAVIVHSGPDKGPAFQPSGAAGSRLLQGVIGGANPSQLPSSPSQLTLFPLPDDSLGAPNKPNHHKLSAGAVVGIVLGCLIGILLIGAAVRHLMLKRQQRQAGSDDIFSARGHRPTNFGL